MIALFASVVLGYSDSIFLGAFIVGLVTGCACGVALVTVWENWRNKK